MRRSHVGAACWAALEIVLFWVLRDTHGSPAAQQAVEYALEQLQDACSTWLGPVQTRPNRNCANLVSCGALVSRGARS